MPLIRTYVRTYISLAPRWRSIFIIQMHRQTNIFVDSFPTCLLFFPPMSRRGRCFGFNFSETIFVFALKCILLRFINCKSKTRVHCDLCCSRCARYLINLKIKSSRRKYHMVEIFDHKSACQFLFVTSIEFEIRIFKVQSPVRL